MYKTQCVSDSIDGSYVGGFDVLAESVFESNDLFWRHFVQIALDTRVDDGHLLSARHRIVLTLQTSSACSIDLVYNERTIHSKKPPPLRFSPSTQQI